MTQYQKKTDNTEEKFIFEIGEPNPMRDEAIGEPFIYNDEEKEPSVLTKLFAAEKQYLDLDPVANILANTTVTTEKLRQEQMSDPELETLFTYFEHDALPTNKKDADHLLKESNHYILDDGILYHIYYPRGKGHMSDQVIKQLVVPRALRDDVLRSYHDCIMAGHPGHERTYNTIRLKYFWKRMWEDIKTYVRTCLECQTAKNNPHAKNAQLQPLPAEGIFARMHMDILCNLPKTTEGYNQILLVVCLFSKWCEAFPLRSGSATEIARILYDNIICRYGAPREFVSDRGQNFMSKLIQEICDIFQITKLQTSSYHPQTNAATERMNATIAQTLHIYCDKNQSNWAKILPSVMMSYRMTVASQSTGYSPYYLVFCREARFPVDIAMRLDADRRLGRAADLELKSIMHDLALAREIAKTNIEKAQEKYKAQFDKKTAEPTFRVEDRVWLYCARTLTGLSPKFCKKWTGPYYICHDYNHYSYLLRRCSDNKQLKAPVHANRLKHYFDPRTRPTNPPQDIADNVDLDPEEIEHEENLNENIENAQNTTNQQDGTQSENAQQKNTCAPSQRKNEDITNTQVPTSRTQSQQSSQDGIQTHDNDSQYEVERILACRKRGNQMQYKIKWLGYTKTSWEPRENISEYLIRQFHVGKTMQNRSRKRKNRK